jgi:protein required for attachment to host cells
MAAQLANMLAAELNANAYDRLVIVAPPTALGDLRASLSDRVRAKVVGEAALDLTKTPNPDVGKHIEHLLAL